MGTLIDTGIISPFFAKKGPPEKLTDWLSGVNDPKVSVVTLFEIELGLKSAGLAAPQQYFPRFLDDFEIKVIEFTSPLARLASDQGSKMRKKGRSYSLQDLWIGATAKAGGYELATANIKDFDHWDGVRVFNPL